MKIPKTQKEFEALSSKKQTKVLKKLAKKAAKKMAKLFEGIDKKHPVEELIEQLQGRGHKVEVKKIDLSNEPNTMEDLLKGLLENLTNKTPIDPDNKVVGDKVELVHAFATAYMVEKESGELILDGKTEEEDAKLKGMEFIVVEDSPNYKFKCNHCSKEHTAQIAIYSKDLDKTFYTMKDLVKLKQ